jgi:hypothetical protein
MTTPSTSNASEDELERVDLQPRSSRGAVVSVRFQADEAQALARRAEKAGLSVSEYARRVLRQSLITSWQVMVWDGQAPLLLGLPPHTGGDYGHRSDLAAAASSCPH